MSMYAHGHPRKGTVHTKIKIFSPFFHFFYPIFKEDVCKPGPLPTAERITKIKIIFKQVSRTPRPSKKDLTNVYQVHWVSLCCCVRPVKTLKKSNVLIFITTESLWVMNLIMDYSQLARHIEIR